MPIDDTIVDRVIKEDMKFLTRPIDRKWWGSNIVSRIIATPSCPRSKYYPGLYSKLRQL